MHITINAFIHLKKDLFASDACNEIQTLNINGPFTFDSDIFEGLQSLKLLGLKTFKNRKTRVIPKDTFKNLHSLKYVCFNGPWLICLEPGCFDGLKLDKIIFHLDDFYKEIPQGTIDNIGDTKVGFSLCSLKNLKNINNNVVVLTCHVEEYPCNIYQLHVYNKKQSLEKVHEMIKNNLMSLMIDYYWYENKPSLGFSRFCDFSVIN